jgi:hypothetical protein
MVQFLRIQIAAQDSNLWFERCTGAELPCPCHFALRANLTPIAFRATLYLVSLKIHISSLEASGRIIGDYPASSNFSCRFAQPRV